MHINSSKFLSTLLIHVLSFKRQFEAFSSFDPCLSDERNLAWNTYQNHKINYYSFFEVGFLVLFELLKYKSTFEHHQIYLLHHWHHRLILDLVVLGWKSLQYNVGRYFSYVIIIILISGNSHGWLYLPRKDERIFVKSFPNGDLTTSKEELRSGHFAVKLCCAPIKSVFPRIYWKDWEAEAKHGWRRTCQ